MKKKSYFIKNLFVITLSIIFISPFTNNKINSSYLHENLFKSVKLNAQYSLPLDRPPPGQEDTYFFPVGLINDKFLFYYSKLNTLNLNSGEVSPLIDTSVLAPWSLLGHSFEGSEPGQFIALSGNRIILPEVSKNESNKSDNSINEYVSISAYDYNTGELIWRTPLEALNVVDLEHRRKLNLTQYGILYSIRDPFLLYCLDADSGKIKWIYNAEEDFGNLSALYHVPACMAYWRSFQFFVRYYYKDGIITYLSYSSKADTPEKSKSIKKHLLISWDGKLISELKYEPLGFIEDKYIFYKEDINSNKYYIGLAKLADSSVIWQRKVPLKLSSSYPIENMYFLFNGKEILISEVPCEILTDYCFLLGGRNDKEDFVNCFSIKNGKEMWTYSLLNESLRDMYSLNGKTFILSGSPSKKVDSITIISNKSGKIDKTYSLNTDTSGEIFYITEISGNYLLFLGDCVVELSNNFDYVSVAPYKELTGSDLFGFGEPAKPIPVIMESENWLVLSIVPSTQGGATGGSILNFSKNENNDLVTEEIAEDSEKNPNYNTAIGKLLSYLLPILTLVLLFVLFMIIFSRKMAHKHK